MVLMCCGFLIAAKWRVLNACCHRMDYSVGECPLVVVSCPIGCGIDAVAVWQSIAAFQTESTTRVLDETGSH